MLGQFHHDRRNGVEVDRFVGGFQESVIQKLNEKNQYRIVG